MEKKPEYATYVFNKDAFSPEVIDNPRPAIVKVEGGKWKISTRLTVDNCIDDLLEWLRLGATMTFTDSDGKRKKIILEDIDATETDKQPVQSA